MSAEAQSAERLLARLGESVLEIDEDLVILAVHGSGLDLKVGLPLVPQLTNAAQMALTPALRSALAGETVETCWWTDSERRHQGRVAGYREAGSVRGSVHLCSSPLDSSASLLDEAQEKLEIAIQASTIGFWSWDLHTDQVIWDKRMHELTGCSEPLNFQRWLDELVHPDDRDVVMKSAPSKRDGGSLSPPPTRIVRPDGEVRWVLTFGRVSQNKDGSPQLMVGGVMDITDQQELSQRVKSAERMEALGHLTAGVAHNFNNMLMVISPCLEHIQRAGPPGLESEIQDAVDASARAAEVVRDLMTFAGQQAKVARKRQRISSLCHRVAVLMQRTFPSGLEIVFESSSSALIESAPGAIEQVLGNLLGNAKDAVAEKAEPEIRLHVSDLENFGDRWVAITVEDSGCGVPQSLRERLFEPFVTSKRGSGTGLGLASSRSIIEQHGGQLAFKDREGGGTEFLILLPAQTPGLLESTKPEPAPSPAAGGTILLIDDEPAIVRILTRGLTRAGFTVLSADSRQSTTSLLEQRPHLDLILLDRSLGDENGADLIPLLRGFSQEAKLYFLTGEPISAEGMSGVDGCIQKPVRIDQLTAIIRQALVE